MEAEGRARAERTRHITPLNMYAMSVTLDVSKPSGWLNASAPCGEKMGVGWSEAQAAGMPRLWRLRAGHARSALETSPPCL